MSTTTAPVSERDAAFSQRTTLHLDLRDEPLVGLAIRSTGGSVFRPTWRPLRSDGTYRPRPTSRPAVTR